MDRALKERIVGAIVLVILAVLVVPVFLDGPATEPDVLTERIPLPGQEEQSVKTVVLERDRQAPVPQAAAAAGDSRAEDTAGEDAGDEPALTLPVPVPVVEDDTPVPARDVAVAAQVDEKPEPVAPAQEPRKNPVAAIAESRQSATGMWAVQLGSFSSKPNADKLAADLRRQGFAAFLSETAGDSGPLHRVRVGPQKDRPAAEAMLARLRDTGQRGQVVPHP